jgi:hydrogenase nickel incorporation protein HypA/HybF
MHELAITESILTIALQHANKAKACRVTEINLVIGNLTSIIDDSISFYWEIISKDTICSQSTLRFTRIPGHLKCNDCLNEYDLENELIPCPQCNSSNVTILRGNEFRVDSIEVIQDE